MKKIAQGLLATFALVASATVFAAPKAEVLILLSSETELPLQNGKTYSSGFYLNELGVPADELLKAGYTLTVVTPRGNQPKPDAHSIDPLYFGNNPDEMQRIAKVVEQVTATSNIKSVRDVLNAGTGNYAGLFIPGGHAPLIDLSTNADVGKLLSHFHAAAKPTAAICHGPIALLAAQDNPMGYEKSMIDGKQGAAKNWIYSGYKMTIFSDAEEKVFEQSLNGEKLRYYPAQAMTQAGGKMNFATAWTPNVVTDRELITGQNPFSDKALAKTFIAALNKQAGAN
ncbi:MAG: type 1 glutamine amidotransferase domain-containing protein [Morganella sp. (in: enterobacteria)]|uniref:Type 1 glutamine amidotransferase domain-containing protein n=1 Tax=Citrobacter tructae TaxID=2562449 RepID=A0ABX5T8G7_9ENTR|nr:type 1 glutamine amidotransferase domain-containing protein [Citrobacter tructae]QBX81588.1 type 1 glutamine amidotransferase domain-containing protein [Citrobacter tructae]